MFFFPPAYTQAIQVHASDLLHEIAASSKRLKEDTRLLSAVLEMVEYKKRIVQPQLMIPALFQLLERVMKVL